MYEIEALVGKLHPLALRDAALDYVYRRTGPNSRTHLLHLPPADDILMVPGDDIFFTHQVISPDNRPREIFYERVLLARRIIPMVAHFFHGRLKGNEVLADIAQRMQEAYNSQQLMLFHQMVAWLTFDIPDEEKNWTWEKYVFYAPPGFNYGLVLKYPNVVLHAAQCLFNVKPGYYEDMLSQDELKEVQERAKELAYNGLD